MNDGKDRIYEFAALDEYSLGKRLQIYLADIVFYLAIRSIGAVTRFEMRGMEHLDATSAADKVPIYAFWHDRIFLGTYFLRDRGIVVMTSKSFDGEYIARFIQRFGFGAIRGSSSRGGSRALIKMIKVMRERVPTAFALDGPRGPRYEAKPGAVVLAKKTGDPILPFILEPKSCWQVKSWDRMQIPKPFTKALFAMGQPIYVDPNASEREIDEKQAELQRALDDLVKVAEEWRRG